MINQKKLFSLNTVLTGLLTLLIYASPAEAKSLQLHWPVKGEIITNFHDKDYEFAHLFEHSGVDIEVPQDTEVRSAISGIVTKVRRPKKGTYSYIVIVGKNGISTVYGHLHGVKVRQNQQVKKGEVIGLSGGLPGTKGAGNLTTGPQLHFELRKEGVPINPVKYLP